MKNQQILGQLLSFMARYKADLCLSPQLPFSYPSGPFIPSNAPISGSTSTRSIPSIPKVAPSTSREPKRKSADSLTRPNNRRLAALKEEPREPRKPKDGRVPEAPEDRDPSEGGKMKERMGTKETNETDETLKPVRITISYPLEQKKKVWDLLKRQPISTVYKLVNYRIPIGTLQKWKKQIDRGRSAERKHGSGQKAHYPALEDGLYKWFLSQRQKQLAVTMTDIQNEALRQAKALQLDGRFKVSKGWVQKFQKRHNLINRQHTRTASKTTQEMAPPIEEFFKTLNNRIKDFALADVWNFDEVRIYFEPNIPHTIERRGEKHVSILTLKAQNMRMTVVLMISAGGAMAPPVLLYYNKRFEPFTVPDYPETLIISNTSGYNLEPTHYTQILPHFLKFLRQGSLLIFDECNAHLSGRVEQLLLAHGVQFLCIPGGATCLLQPVDCGIGKRVKQDVKKQFMHWCSENFEMITTPDSRRKKSFKKPTNRDVARWVLQGVRNVNPEAIRNSFVYTGIVSTEMQHKILHEKLPQYFVNKVPLHDSPVPTKAEAEAEANPPALLPPEPTLVEIPQPSNDLLSAPAPKSDEKPIFRIVSEPGVGLSHEGNSQAAIDCTLTPHCPVVSTSDPAVVKA